MRTHEGGRRSEHRVRGCMVDLVDMSLLRDAALKVLAAIYQMDVSDLRLEGWGPLESHYALINVDKQRVALVGAEGVGNISDVSTDRIEINLYAKDFWHTRVPLSKRVLQGMLTGEQVDLADHIRSFGDRLESNFALWFKSASFQDARHMPNA